MEGVEMLFIYLLFPVKNDCHILANLKCQKKKIFTGFLTQSKVEIET